MSLLLLSSGTTVRRFTGQTDAFTTVMTLFVKDVEV